MWCATCDVSWNRFPGDGLDVSDCWMCGGAGTTTSREPVVFPRAEIRNPTTLQFGDDGRCVR